MISSATIPVRILAGGRNGEIIITNNYTIAPGQSITALNFSGEGAITAFKVRVNGMASSSDQWAALRALTVSMSWDGATNASVWRRSAIFSALLAGIFPTRRCRWGMLNNGWMYCYWYMPFAIQAQIVIGNDGNVSRNVDVVITRAPLAKPIGSLARFHAKWESRRLCDNDGRSPDYRFLGTSGRGRFVGLGLHVYQTVDLSPGPWWGEGDEKFFVDGEKIPSWFGTGSEDYFGFCLGHAGLLQQSLSHPGPLAARHFDGSRQSRSEPVSHFGQCSLSVVLRRLH
ncbi:MAG: DUF2961 domain-containing protein [Limisphaerales bacterium]